MFGHVLVGEVRVRFNPEVLRCRVRLFRILRLTLAELYKMMNVARRDFEVTFFREYLRYATVGPVSAAQLVKQLGVRLQGASAAVARADCREWL